MAADAQYHALPPRRELTTLLALAAIQFTHFVDYMIMMPLGPQLMRRFEITPEQFSQLVACYPLAAAFAGLAGGFVLDRHDRKRALLVLYAGFGMATGACGLAGSHHALMAARFAAGIFGGLAGSVVVAMVADVIPPERRGRAMSLVMGSFPVASVLGVPAGLLLAGRFGWHTPFFALAAAAVTNLTIASFALPHLATAVRDRHPWRQIRDIVSHGVHLRAFAVGAALVMAGQCVIPFIAPSMVANMGLSEGQLVWPYAVGGLCAFFSMPIVGRLSDRMDRLRLFAGASAVCVVVVLVLTHLGPSPVWLACAMMACFMVTMTSRFTPAMTMVTNAVEARYRGGFMSLNSALQQGSSALANFIAGMFVTEQVSGRLAGLPKAGYASIGFLVVAVLLAAELRRAAPHVSTPASARPAPPVEPAVEAAA